jgi:L-asparaginase
MNVYLLYTGGTIGSVGTPLGPMTGPQFVSAFQSLVQPIITSQLSGTTINYDYFTPTLDSTNMQPLDWVTIAQRILANYATNDAFLVLHGTDTMAWTASALSFLLPGLSKPVFVTGSQLPMFYQPSSGGATTFLFNTDALRNVLGAFEFLTFGIPEVGLYFADTLLRGNRAVKSNASGFTAFSSPNFPALGNYGVLAKLNDSLILPMPTSANALDNDLPQVSAELNTIAGNIATNSILQFLIFPAYYNSTTGASLLVSMLQQLQQVSPPLKGVIFEAFGEGNIPDFAQMQQLLTSMTAAGITLVDCTQVYSGDVNYNAYATGAWLPGAGVLSGFDMTPIAALTKLIVYLALHPGASASDIQLAMGTDAAGEMIAFYELSGYQSEFLSSGESLYSINGAYQFTNEGDGTLTLYNLTGTSPVVVWSQAMGDPGRLVMQADCNLVFYNKDFQALWSSGTQQIGTNAVFQVNGNGTLTINDMYTGALIVQIN